MTVFNIIQNYGEAFSTFYNNTGILFGLEEGFFLPKRSDFFQQLKINLAKMLGFDEFGHR